MLTVAQPRQLKNLCPKALKRRWPRKRNLQQFVCAATGEGGPQASFGTTEISLPSVDLFQDLATEKEISKDLYSFLLKFITDEEQGLVFQILPSLQKH